MVYTSDVDVAYPFPWGSVHNCIVYGNTASFRANYWSDIGGGPSYSCTTPMGFPWAGNITNAPLFVDAAAGDFRLQPNAPCINAGQNGGALLGPDLGGNPRIVGGTLDIGAYEFQSPHSTISYAWLQQYGLPTDGLADLADTDGDGHNNWQEWRAWTDPTNSLSALRLLPPENTNGLQIRWQSVSGQNYFLERSINPGAHPTFAPLASNIVGQPDMTTFVDTNGSDGAIIYRVGVRY